MIRTTKEKTGFLGNEKGFTLIEMAIVLVIIGLILGSVLKGKDLINSAKQKQFYNTFVKGWELAITSYYDRTGFLLGDGTANGGVYPTTNGIFDYINGGEFANIDAALQRVGLAVIQTNTANSYQYSFTGAFSGNQTITLYLYYRTNYNTTSNAMLLYNVPVDLAYSLDKIIDGQVNATTGRCVLDQGGAGATWGDASTGATVNMAITIQVP